MVGVADPLETCFFTTVPNLVILGQNNTNVINRDPAEKLFDPTICFSRSLKVTGTNTDWLATYDFLLLVHSNHGPISYHIRDKQQFQTKSQISPMYLMPQLRKFPLEYCNGGRPQQTTVMPLPERGKSLTVCAFVVIYWVIPARDGQMWHHNIMFCMYKHADAR